MEHRLPVAALLALTACSVSAADLTVELHNVKPKRGEIRAAVFDDQTDFERFTKIRAMVKDGQIASGVFTRDEDFDREPAAIVKTPAQGRIMTLRVPDLAPGVYAFAVFQDLNGTETLDVTLGGMSLEPWGISNDAVHLDADPRWDEAKFTLPPEGLTIVVHLRDERQEKHAPR